MLYIETPALFTIRLFFWLKSNNNMMLRQQYE